MSGKSLCRPGFLFRQGSDPWQEKYRSLLEKLRLLTAEEASE